MAELAPAQRVVFPNLPEVDISGSTLFSSVSSEITKFDQTVGPIITSRIREFGGEKDSVSLLMHQAIQANAAGTWETVETGLRDRYNASVDIYSAYVELQVQTAKYASLMRDVVSFFERTTEALKRGSSNTFAGPDRTREASVDLSTATAEHKKMQKIFQNAQSAARTIEDRVKAGRKTYLLAQWTIAANGAAQSERSLYISWAEPSKFEIEALEPLRDGGALVSGTGEFDGTFEDLDATGSSKTADRTGHGKPNQLEASTVQVDEEGSSGASAAKGKKKKR